MFDQTNPRQGKIGSKGIRIRVMSRIFSFKKLCDNKMENKKNLKKLLQRNQLNKTIRRLKKRRRILHKRKVAIRKKKLKK